jgi:hypothetical protein
VSPRRSEVQPQSLSALEPPTDSKDDNEEEEAANKSDSDLGSMIPDFRNFVNIKQAKFSSAVTPTKIRDQTSRLRSPQRESPLPVRFPRSAESTPPSKTSRKEVARVETDPRKIGWLKKLNREDDF